MSEPAPSNKKATLVRMTQYIFRRETDNIRQDLHDALVKQAIYLKGEKVTETEIKESVEKIINARDFPLPFLRESLGRLLKKGQLQAENGNYLLVTEINNQISEIIRKRQISLENAEKTFAAKLKSYNLSDEQCKTALEIVYEFLAHILSRDAKCATSFLAGKPSSTDILASKDLLDVIFQTKGVDPDIRNALRSFMGSVVWDEVEALFSAIAQNFLYLELLQLDPECNLLKKEALSKKTLFLDTNVVMSLLLPIHGYHEFTLRLLEIAKVLGVKMVFTEETKQEFLNRLDQANIRWRSLRGARPSLLKKAHDDFIKSYIYEREKNPQGWSGYFFMLRQVETLLEKKGISIYNYTPDSTKEGLPQNKELFKKVVSDVYYYADKVSNNIKPVSVAEHDAFHLLLVRDLQRASVSDMFGPQFLFLTYDVSLSYVDNKINKHICVQDAISSIHPRIWLDVVTPFLSPNIVNEELPSFFGKLMKSDFTYIPVTIHLDTLVEVAGPWLDYDNLTDEDIGTILRDKTVQSLVAKIKTSLKKDDLAGADRNRVAVAKLIDTKTLDILNQKISALSQQFSQQSSEMSKMATLLNKEARSRISANRWSFFYAIVGALASILAFIFLNVIMGTILLLLVIISLIIRVLSSRAWLTGKSRV